MSQIACKQNPLGMKKTEMKETWVFVFMKQNNLQNLD